MTHIALLVAYDGSSYFGWQKTKEGPSVEGTLEDVLSKIFQEPIALQAASRTDRGVHASGQVVECFTSKRVLDFHRLMMSSNALLPTDIRVLSVREVPENFHPTLDVLSKVYRYNISLGPVQSPFEQHTHWHVHIPLEQSLLHDASKELIGTHDFRGFTNFRKDLRTDDTIRTILRIDINHRENGVQIEIEGNNFLYKMCRNLVGTMVWIAVGKISKSAIQTTLSSRNRVDAGVTAPAHGLTLCCVTYASPIF